MPTYKFTCEQCQKEWAEQQSTLFDGTKHLSKCPECNKECESFPTGGTGVLMKGKRMDKYLEGFPDFTNAKNKNASKEGEDLEKKHDAYLEEQKRKDEKS